MYNTSPAAAAKVIKQLATEMGGMDVTVEVRNHPRLFIRLSFGIDNHRVCGFTLTEQVNCCGILVSTQTYVEPAYRGQKYAQQMMPLKSAIAKEFGYSLLLATVNMTGNPAEVHILEKDGWKQSHVFINQRTKNQVGVFTKGVA